jgi:polyhydroxyalkanoate synthase
VRSNYFRGENPPAHPLLYWSMDYTRVPAELQCDFMDLGHTNPLALGHLTVAGRQIDLRNIDYPVYVMAGSTDHITPWNACYRSVHLFAGDVQFVLTNQNHTQTISARPDNRHLKYWLGEDLPETADAWLDHAQEVSGNWRDHWVRWLQGHSTLRAAPDRCGSTTYPPLQAAPGSYVRE